MEKEFIALLKKEIKEFKTEDFICDASLESILTVMPDNEKWAKPVHYPTHGEHPRLGINKNVLDKIKKYVLETDEGRFLKAEIKAIADEKFIGVLEKPYMHETGRRGFHNVDEHGLAVIEARAFIFLLSGDEEYGYKAVLSMKNYLSTFYFGYVYSDQCREIGRMIFVLAEIYDWCYTLLTEKDKEQFIYASAFWMSGDAEQRYNGKYKGLCGSGNRYMEVSYPPQYQNGISGHGCEAQILRDYFAISIAIFDENPSWYNYVGARVFSEFIPFRNFYFKSGMYPQGINMYAPHRFTSDMWCAWLSITSLGKNPYTDDLQRTANGFLDYRLSDGTFFGAGDGVRQKKISPNIMYSMAIGAAIYGDPTLRGAVLQFYNGNISSLNKETATTVFSLVHHTILGAEYFAKHGSTKAFNLNETRKAVRYHSYPIGEMITEERPNDLNSPASFMFIGEKSTANHDHADAGTFQLSYKDLQFVDAGVYDKYGSAHWRYYHQATIGHNGLLFFDPSRVQDEMEDGNFANPKTLDGYFYSGGQRNFYNSGFNFEEWLNSEETNTAKVMSHGYRLRTDGTCDFAYIAGDITSAYTPSQVSRVERKMLTLYTSDKKRTMHFVVYDSADLASPQIVSKFLFHTPVEPHIDNKRKKVSFIKNETKLELFALLGTDKIESLGGEGAEYLINGKQCAEAKTKPDGMWGRIELSSTGKTTQEFLNVMSFASLDADKLMPEVLDGDNYKGVLLDGVAVIFAKGNKFPVLNIKCAKRYIILGLADGEYSISLGNGSSSKYTCASGAIVINL